MSGPTDPPGPRLDGWERIAEELHACCASQRRAWGDVENVALGRYLAGEADAAEAADIERALDDHPELRQLTAVVRGVLDDLGPPAWDAAPLAAPPPLRLAALPPRRPAAWLRRHASLVAAACLLVILGAAMPSAAPLAGLRQGPPVSFPLAGGTASRASPREGLALTDAAAWAAGGARRELPDPALVPPPVRDASKRAFVYFHHTGDLCRAAREHEAVLAYCNDHLPAGDPARARAVRQLADVYQVALNTNPAAADPTRRPPRSRADQAAALHREIGSRPIAEVRATVVPVLAEALRTAPAPADRRRFLRALARLGPAAGPAVPALTQHLLGTTDDAEAGEVLAVFEALGPGARADWPPAARASERPAVKEAALAANDRAMPLKSAAAVRTRGAELYARLNARLEGRAGRVGVLDRAGCFTVRAARDATDRLRALARDHGVEVLVETTAEAVEEGQLPPREHLPARAVHVLISLKGPAVLVRSGRGLPDLAAGAVRARAADRCKERDHDAALREVLAALVKAAR